MPFKHYAAHRHRIPRARYRVRNWPAYEAGLGRRGNLTFWLDEAALPGWRAPRRTTPGGQARYSDLAIELVLTLQLVFHLALRQAAAFASSVLRLLGVELPVPDHTTLSRRSRAFAGRRSRVAWGGRNGPAHLVLDSTGLQLFGQGEWDAEKHGRVKRRWMKLHVAVNATTGEIVAHALTEGTADDAAQVPDLLGRVEGTIASVSADGAYDGEPTYAAVGAARGSADTHASTGRADVRRGAGERAHAGTSAPAWAREGGITGGGRSSGGSLAGRSASATARPEARLRSKGRSPSCVGRTAPPRRPAATPYARRAFAELLPWRLLPALMRRFTDRPASLSEATRLH